MIQSITVVGLGSGTKEGLTLGAWDILKQAKRLILRTEHHPIVHWLQEQGVCFVTCDSIYQKYERFDNIYASIVEQLVAEVQTYDEIVYAVPGHPSVAEKTVELLRAACPERQIELRLVGSESFLDRAFMALGFDPADGFQLLDATQLNAKWIQPYHHILITQVYDTDIASEVKLTLMERYPDHHEVVLAHALGIKGEEQITKLPLYQLDHVRGYGNLSLIYIPRTEQDEIHYRTFDKLHEIIAKLRSPQGCPWDREQTHQTLRPYMIEETFEALEAIDHDDPLAMQEELGDILLQILLHAQIEEELGTFNIYDVLQGLAEKMVRRHPHVFGDQAVSGVQDVVANWQHIKAMEKQQNGKSQDKSILSGVPSGMPSLSRSVALQKKAAKVGFDWREPEQIAAKIKEELAEFEAELHAQPHAQDSNSTRLLEEMGDLIFAVVNLARFLDLDPEDALAKTNRKFIQRFQYIEGQLRLRNISFDQTDIQQLEQWWQETKRS